MPKTIRLPKIRVSFKTPDALEHPILEACEELERTTDNDDEEAECLSEVMYDLASKWVKGGEYVTIELDLAEGTAKVIEAS